MNVEQKLVASLRWKLTSRTKKQVLLAETLEKARISLETAEMLELADRNGIEIVFNDKLIWQAASARLVTIPETGKRRIELSPETQDTFALKSSLAHELRHVVQEIAMQPLIGDDYWFSTLSPKTCLLYLRLIEADAMAYSIVDMHQSIQVMQGAATIIEKLLAEGIVPNSPEWRSKSSEEMMRHRAAQKPDHDVARDAFNEAVREGLHNYDRKVVRSCGYWQMNDKDAPALPRVLTIDDMRRYLPLPYLDHLSDRALEVSLLRKVKPQVRNAVRLMEKFALNADKNTPESLVLRQKAQRAVTAALSSTPSSRTK